MFKLQKKIKKSSAKKFFSSCLNEQLEQVIEKLGQTNSTPRP